MKERILELAKSRGLEIGEEAVEQFCHLGVDIVKILAEGNPIAVAVVASIESTARQAIDNIDLNNDGK